MRINEILTESQLEQLEEGPILNKIGSAVGKGVGALAKGVGAVAGGVAGLGAAVKKGFQAGKGVVSGAGDDVPAAPAASGAAAPAAGKPAAGGAAAAPAAGGAAAAPAADPAAPSGTAPSTQDINAQGPAGTAPAKAQTGAAGAALAKTTAAVDQQTTTKAGETVYAQVKANVDKLDKKGKQRILQLLTKSMAAPDPKSAAPAAVAKRAGAKAAPGAGAFDNMAKALSQEPTKAPAAAAPAADPAAAAPAADPAAAAPAADPAAAAPAADPAAAKVPKKTGGASRVPKKPAPTPTASAQADAGKPGFLQSKIKGSQVTASLVHRGKSLNEVFAQRLSMHKQKMFETGLARGTLSVFRK
jgi:hypothetical protein